MKTTVIVIPLFLLAIIVLYTLFFWLTYINETLENGEGYGFVIGASKAETYTKLNENLSKMMSFNTKIFIEIEVDDTFSEVVAVSQGYTIMVQSLLHNEASHLFLKRDRWDFYIGPSYFNTLSLRFCGDKLCKIHRHRKYFELP